MLLLALLVCNVVYTTAQTASVPVPGKPQLDDKPIFTNNYIPATMQIIMYLTDLMKYDISAINKPQKPLHSPPAATVPPPTRPHKPGYYAPERPPTTVRTIDKSKKSRDKHINKYTTGERFPKDIEYLADEPKRILTQINTIDDYDQLGEYEFRLEDFNVNYEDDIPDDFLRVPMKRAPPTRAYVQLLSLYDAMNKDAKKQGLSKFNGYSKQMLEFLIGTSSGTATDQLRVILKKAIEQQEIKRNDARSKATNLLNELENSESAVATQIRYYAPLQFVE